MHSVAPRTGPDEVNVAEEQHEYRQLVAVPYLLNYAEGREPAYTLLTRWRFTAEDRRLIAGGEDLYLAVLTFGNPLQPLNVQVGPCAPTDWRVPCADDATPTATARPQTGPAPVMTPEDWAGATGQVERGQTPEVHRCVVALSNYALADDDPQKFTHEHVDMLRDLSDRLDPQTCGTAEAMFLEGLANLLENYLPPR